MTAVTASSEQRFDTGRTCLDLLATVGSRLSNSPVERLDSPDRLVQWLHGAGLVPRADELGRVPGWLEDFRSLRELLHRIIHTELGGQQAEGRDLARLNRIAAAGNPVLQAARESDGSLRAHLRTPIRLDQLLAAVADDAIRLLSSPERDTMRQCEGPTCDLVYLDTSRGHRRRWCSAAACGNRHYVAAHRARKAEA